MFAFMIVVVQPGLQCGIAFLGGLIDPPVCPATHQRLNEPFGFAIGLWRIGPCSAMFESKEVTESFMDLCAIAPTIVGHDFFDDYAKGFEMSDGIEQKLFCRQSRLIGKDLCKPQTTGGVDADMEVVIACFPGLFAPITRHGMSGFCKARKALDVDVNEFSTVSPCVAIRSGYRVEIGLLGKVVSPQHL